MVRNRARQVPKMDDRRRGDNDGCMAGVGSTWKWTADSALGVHYIHCHGQSELVFLGTTPIDVGGISKLKTSEEGVALGV